MGRQNINDIPELPRSEAAVRQERDRRRKSMAANVEVDVRDGKLLVLPVEVRDADGTLVLAEPGYEWTLRARDEYLDEVGELRLTLDQHAALLVASLEWWKRRCTSSPFPGEDSLRHPVGRWPACDKGRRWLTSEGLPGDRRSLARYMHEVSVQGTASCSKSWACCSWCQHGRAVVQIARGLSAGGPHWSVTFSPKSADVEPLAFRNAVAECLDWFAAANPGLLLSHGVLVPSYRSNTARLSGRLHMHVLLSWERTGYFPFPQFKAFVERCHSELRPDAAVHVVAWPDLRRRTPEVPGVRAEVMQTALDVGRAWAYVAEQAAWFAYPDSTFPCMTPWTRSTYDEGRMSRKFREALKNLNADIEGNERARIAGKFAQGRGLPGSA